MTKLTRSAASGRALGLHDMAGNAAEWVMAADGKPMTCGGSYRDDADQVGCAARRPPSNDWERQRSATAQEQMVAGGLHLRRVSGGM